MFVILETQVSVAYPGFPSRGTYYLAKYLPKTAWKWKKLDRERCVCHLSPFGSVTRSIPAFEAFSYNGITSNDSPFGCPIIYTDTNSQRYFVHRHPNNAWHNNVHSVIVMPCLTKITSNRIFASKSSAAMLKNSVKHSNRSRVAQCIFMEITRTSFSCWIVIPILTHNKLYCLRIDQQSIIAALIPSFCRGRDPACRCWMLITEFSLCINHNHVTWPTVEPWFYI